jgi:Patatin-like phospholipase
MESGAAPKNNYPSGSGRATLNEVLYAELEQLRPSLLTGVTPKTFAESPQERTQNLSAIYDRSKSASLSALCLSGGGIRSATFNLGVLQALAKIGLLGKFDYLSSVSGGGYIAAWLRTWMSRENVAGVVKALGNPAEPRNPLAPEPAPVVNLREYSNYLTPHLGLFSGDTWAAAGIIARNLLLNWLVLVPLLAAVTGIPLLFRLIVLGTGIPESWHWQLLFAALGIELLASLSVYSFRRFAKRPGIPQAYFIFGCVLPICLAAGVLILAALGLNLPWHNSLPHPCCSDITGLWKFSFAWCLGVPFIGWLAAEILARLFPRWTLPAPTAAPAQIRRAAWMYELLGLLISGLVGTALLVLVVSYCFSFLYLHPDAYVILALPILLGIYLISRALFVGIASLGDSSQQRGSDDDADREWWARLSGWVLLVMTGWIAVTGFCLFGLYLAEFFDRFLITAGPHSSRTLIDGVKVFVAALGTLSGVVAAFTGSSSKTPANGNARTAPPPAMTQLLVQVAGMVFLICVIIMLSWGMRSLGQWLTGESRLFSEPMSWEAWLQFLFLILGLALLSVVASRPVNVNRFSLHGMYRNRLVRAYLGASNCSEIEGKQRQPDPFTGFSLSDNLPLHTLCPQPEPRPTPNPIAPPAEARLLLIINTTLNLVHGENLAWQQRKAESFSMTPLYCGNWLEGYRRSTEYGGRGGITVGTAMTISGAAANPNMGYNSSPVLAFLMSIFNVRLGAWLGNTNAKGDKTFFRIGPKLALMPLFAEVFGLTNSSRGYVNLSDGGHFDNLGLYEVVLRRCRHVLVSDAGNDASFAFEDLGNAIRKIRIDFGIPIEFKAKIEILPNDSEGFGKPSRPGLYCAIADIRYSAMDGNVPDGQLIYIKPTLRGHIPTESGGEVPYDIYSYARSSKDFPHETTVDQWFSESQFESYRALGSHILEQLGDPLTDASFESFLTTAREHIESVRKHIAETKP